MSPYITVEWHSGKKTLTCYWTWSGTFGSRICSTEVLKWYICILQSLSLKDYLLLSLLMFLHLNCSSKKTPNYNFMRLFGCLYFPHTRDFKKHKFDYRSRPCVFMRYSSCHLDYKCMDKHSRVYISRHVQFSESVYLFSLSSKSSTYGFNSTYSLFSPLSMFLGSFDAENDTSLPISTIISTLTNVSPFIQSSAHPLHNVTQEVAHYVPSYQSPPYNPLLYTNTAGPCALDDEQISSKSDHDHTVPPQTIVSPQFCLRITNSSLDLTQELSQLYKVPNTSQYIISLPLTLVDQQSNSTSVYNHPIVTFIPTQ